MTIETMDTVVTGMRFMAEGERLDRRAFPQIQRQYVHQRKNGNDSDYQNDQAADKPCYFHTKSPGRNAVNECQDAARSTDIHNNRLIAAVKTRCAI